MSNQKLVQELKTLANALDTAGFHKEASDIDQKVFKKFAGNAPIKKIQPVMQKEAGITDWIKLIPNLYKIMKTSAFINKFDESQIKGMTDLKQLEDIKSKITEGIIAMAKSAVTIAEIIGIAAAAPSAGTSLAITFSIDALTAAITKGTITNETVDQLLQVLEKVPQFPKFMATIPVGPFAGTAVFNKTIKSAKKSAQIFKTVNNRIAELGGKSSPNKVLSNLPAKPEDTKQPKAASSN